MSLRISALEFDTLVRASERPEPIPFPLGAGAVPINPMLFPNDWGMEVSLSSRWETDITRAHASGKPEKWSLLSRPSRSLEVSIVGASKEESFALLQSAFDYSTRIGFPAPIYPDASVVTGFTYDSGTSTGRVTGDFRYRRFFIGGRVCFMPLQIDPDKGQNSVIFGTILELGPEEMLVQFTATAYRTVTTLDSVIPCMDVEMAEKLTGVALTDSVYRLSLTWEELDGASALPATWPAVMPDNSEVITPLCEILDNLPIFPFNPNWSEGVQIEMRRDVSRDRIGRTSVQDPYGVPYHAIALSVMGYDREACWKVVRFFDAMRGRAGSFYMIHPHRPWVLSSFVNNTRILIKAIGSATGVYSHFKKLVFIRANGEKVTRTAVDASRLSGGLFRVDLDSALPDLNFVEVQPILICSFEQDDLVERWANTSTVPAFELSIVEEPNYGISGAVTNIGYAEESPGFLGVAGCNLLLKAGVGCYTTINGVVMPVGPFPQLPQTVSFWEDESRKVVRTQSSPYGKKRFALMPGGGSSTSLIRWPIPFQNGGELSIKDAYFSYEYQLNSSIPVKNRHLWDENLSQGWTLFICYSPEFYDILPGTDRRLFRIVSPEGTLDFRFDSQTLTGPGRARVINQPTGSATQIWPLTYSLGFLGIPTLMTLRLDFSVSPAKIHVWVNGQKALATSGNFTKWEPTSYSISEWFTCFWKNVPTTSAWLASQYNTSGAANLVASYARALSSSELDQVHKIIGTMYKTSMEPSSIYA